MKNPGGGNGKYAPLQAAHRQITSERFDRNMREVTDIRAERRDADIARVSKEPVKDVIQPKEAPARTGPVLAPTGLAPGESQLHIDWRRSVAARIARDEQRAATKRADEIPRILRTEKDPIRARVEVDTVLNLREEEKARHARRLERKRSEKSREERDQDVEAEPE